MLSVERIWTFLEQISTTMLDIYLILANSNHLRWALLVASDFCLIMLRCGKSTTCEDHKHTQIIIVIYSLVWLCKPQEYRYLILNSGLTGQFDFFAKLDYFRKRHAILFSKILINLNQDAQGGLSDTILEIEDQKIHCTFTRDAVTEIVTPVEASETIVIDLVKNFKSYVNF